MELIIVACGSTAYSLVGIKDKGYSVVLNNATLEAIGKFLYQHRDSQFETVNFSLAGDTIKETAGSFSRLRQAGADPVIIIAEMRTKSGRLVGYEVFDQNTGSLRNIRVADMYGFCETAKARNTVAVQNGIYRELKGVKQIACYPDKPFRVITLETTKKVKAQAKPITEPAKGKTRKVDLSKEDSGFTKEQLIELKSAKDNGVNPTFIANKKLTPRQMRILWSAKKNGIPSEYFARPEFSEEVMDYLAVTLVTPQVFKDCYPILNPKYSKEQIIELYLGIMEGVDISSFSDPKTPVEDMYVARQTATDRLYDFGGDQEKPSGYYTQRAIRFTKSVGSSKKK